MDYCFDFLIEFFSIRKLWQKNKRQHGICHMYTNTWFLKERVNSLWSASFLFVPIPGGIPDRKPFSTWILKSWISFKHLSVNIPSYSGLVQVLIKLLRFVLICWSICFSDVLYVTIFSKQHFNTRHKWVFFWKTW